ncbi:MAG TPA: 30S ribosomal protein S3 [bacterium]|jgi:small subunit ribosomal protein S3
MGQKVHPVGFRLGISRRSDANWFADKRSFAEVLYEDLVLRKELKRKFKNGGVDKIVTERDPGRVKIVIFTSRPGIIIGSGGSNIERVRKDLQKLVKSQVLINIQSVDRPDLSAALNAQAIARQIEERKRFRRVMKQTASRIMKNKALGVKIMVKGRLDGSEMARMETYREGRVPLHTLRADIDYSYEVAKTTYGVIGVKVWIYRGDIPTNLGKTL